MILYLKHNDLQEDGGGGVGKVESIKISFKKQQEI